MGIVALSKLHGEDLSTTRRSKIARESEHFCSHSVPVFFLEALLPWFCGLALLSMATLDNLCRIGSAQLFPCSSCFYPKLNGAARFIKTSWAVEERYVYKFYCLSVCLSVSLTLSFNCWLNDEIFSESVVLSTRHQATTDTNLLSY